jgi:hypothetical protein
VGADGVQAAAALEHGLSIVRLRRTGLHWEGLFLAQLAEAHLQQGEGDRARARVEEAVRSARGRSTRAIECRAELAHARVLLGTEGVASRGAVAAALAQARARVEETGATIHEPFIHVELARLARLTGDEAARQRELREAHRRFTTMGATAQARRIAAEIESAAS